MPSFYRGENSGPVTACNFLRIFQPSGSRRGPHSSVYLQINMGSAHYLWMLFLFFFYHWSRTGWWLSEEPPFKCFFHWRPGLVTSSTPPFSPSGKKREGGGAQLDGYLEPHVPEAPAASQSCGVCGASSPGRPHCRASQGCRRRCWPCWSTRVASVTSSTLARIRSLFYMETWTPVLDIHLKILSVCSMFSPQKRGRNKYLYALSKG